MSQFLKHKFEEAKKSNPAFSLRAFAQRAGISSGAMTEILRGKRSLSAKSISKISQNLKLNPSERSQFEFEKAQSLSKTETAVRKPLTFISRGQFQYIVEGFHFALVSLLDTTNFSSEEGWIAKRLSISTVQARLAIQRLVNARILRWEQGELKKEDKIFSTTDDIQDSLIQSSHLDTLKSAKKSLLKNTIQRRDFTHMCVAIDPNNLNQFKQLVRKFQDEVELLAQKSGSKSEVYKLAIQFFPMTNAEDFDGKTNEDL